MSGFQLKPLVAGLRKETVLPAGHWMRVALGAVLAGGATTVLAAGSNIEVASGFNTTVTASGNTHTITNGLMKGSVAVNGFNHFVVGQGDIAKLMVPDQASKLVNLVRNKVEVHGLLESYQNNALGGDVLFASSQGFLVGPQGIVNVGKLTVTTPDSDYMTRVLGDSSAITTGDIDALQDGSLAVSPSGLVRIEGKVVTAQGTQINANQVQLATGAYLINGNAQAAVYEAAVNTGDATAPTALKADGGTLVIAAAGDGLADGDYAVDIDGDAWADGGIEISANTIRVAANGVLDTRNGTTKAAAGEVTLAAEASAQADPASLLGGAASAHAEVLVEGHIIGTHVNATAKTTVTAEYTAEDAETCKDNGEGGGNQVGGCWLSVSNPLDMGFPLNNLEAHASALVKVTGKIDASGDVSLAAETQTSVATSGIGKIGEGDDEVLYAAPFVYGAVDAQSEVLVASTASVSADGDLSLSAFNDADLSIKANAAPALEGEDYSDQIVVAYGNAKVKSSATLASGAAIDATNVTVMAENQSAFDVSAKAPSGALAFGLFDTDATAWVGADLGTNAQPLAGDVLVAAVDRVTRQQVDSASSAESAENFYTVGSLSIGAITQVKQRVQELIETYAGDASDDMAKDEDKPSADADQGGGQSGQGGLTWQAGVAVSLNISSHDATARIANTAAGLAAPEVYTAGQVGVIAQTETTGLKTQSTSKASIEKEEDSSGGTGGGSGSGSSGESKGIAVSIATNVTVRNSKAVAEVGDYVRISAKNVGVAAEQRTLINNPWSEWDSLVDILDGLKSSKDSNFGVDDVVTSFANAQAGGEEADFSFGGAFNVQLVSHDTSAWVGDGAYITTTGSDDWSIDQALKGSVETTTDNPSGETRLVQQWDAATAVTAHNVTQSVNLNGNMGEYLVKPGNSATEGNAIGGTVAYVEWSGSAIAGVGAARVETGTGSLGIDAQSDDLQVLVTPSSGEGKGVAFSGALAILNVDDYTSASLSNLAQVVASKVRVTATQILSHWAAAGALAMSNETAIGAGAAVVLSDGDTRAYVGDNSADAVRIASDAPAVAAGTSPVTAAGIISREVRVIAQSSGMVGALAAAGAVAQEEKAPKPGAEGEAKKEPGLVDKFKGFIEDPGAGLIGAFTGATEDDESSDTSIAGATKDGKTGESTPGGTGGATGGSTDPLKSAGLSAAGAFTVAVADINVESFIDGATIGAPGSNAVDLVVQALNKTLDISAAGAAALVMNKKPQSGTTAALAGAIAYQISHNDTLAHIKDSLITQAGDVSVNALSGGERVSVGLGVSGNTTSGSGQSISAAVSLSAAQVKDQTKATIEGSDIEAQGADRSVAVNAYNNTDIGVGGGSVYAGGKTGVGLAVTFATVGNPDGGDAIHAAIDDSRIHQFDQVMVTASNISRIVLAAAGVGVQSADSGPAISAGGSFAVGDISTRTRALITGGSQITANALAVNALGTKQDAYDQALADVGTSNANADFDFSGSSAYSKTGTHTSEDDAGEQVSYDSEGERIITVAGQVNVALGQSGGAGGIAYSHADIHTKREARIDDAQVTITNGVDINARNDALIYNFAIGAAVSQGSFSGVGSVTTSRINNQVIAEVGDWNASSDTYVKAGSLEVAADNHAQIISLAGGVALTMGSGVAAGLAASVNLVGDRGGENGHITRARVGHAELDVTDLEVEAQSGSPGQRNQIIGNAVGVGISTGGLAFAGAVDVNSVDQQVEAGVKAIDGVGVDGAGVLKVSASDNTYSVGTAWSIAGSGGGAALGVAVVVNRVVDNVLAELLGGGSGVYRVNGADVRASRNLELLTLDAGVAVSDTVAISPSVGTAWTSGVVNARIAQGADLVAQHNVQVTADSDLLSHAASGALGVGVEGGAGAIAVSTVIDDTTTAAYIDHASVTALGLGAGVDANSGVLAGSANLAELSDSDSNLDRGQLEQGFTTHYQKEGKETVTGLVVNATSYNRMMAVEIAGAGGLGAGIAVNAATHAFNGDTQAYIDSSDINQSGVLGNGADVLVRAGAHNSAMGITAGIAGSAGVSAVAGLVLNLEDHDTQARISNTTVDAQTLRLDANATSLMQGVAVGVAAGGFGGAASVVTNKLDGDTLAQLTGGVTTADVVKVTATKAEESNAATGSAGIGAGVGLGIGLIANLGSGNTQALVGQYDASGKVSATPNTVVHVNELAVNAVRTETLQSYAFGLGVDASFAGAGIAGMLSLSDTTGETRAGVYATQVRGKAGANSRADNISITATEYFKAEQHAAALGIGGAGIGAAFNVVLNVTQTIAELVNGDVRADQLSVAATSDNDTFVTSVAGGAGSFGGAISLGYVRQGSGSGGDALGELQGSMGSVNGALGAGNAASNNHTLSSSERAQLNNQGKGSVDVASTETGVSAEDLQPVDGKALMLSGAKVTAARIAGGTVNVNNLVVDSEGRTHSEILSGGVAAGLIGASGGLGVIRNYNQNMALVDAAVSAKNVSVNAIEKDGAKGSAADLVAFSGAAGGIAIGVAVSDAQVKNRVLATVTQAVGDNTGSLSVQAQDTTSVRVGGDNENAPSNVTVAWAAVGLSHAAASKASHVSAVLGGAGRVVGGYNTIDVDALVEGVVRSVAFTASLAYFGTAQGVLTRASDSSIAQVSLAGTLEADDRVSVDSQAFAETYARSFGISVAAGVAIGVSDAQATANTQSLIDVASATTFQGDAHYALKADTGFKAGSHNADARAYAASGGILAGASAARAKADNDSKSRVTLGDDVTLPQGNFSAQANASTSQHSDADGVFAGLLAVGANRADTNSNVLVQTMVGTNLRMANPQMARAGDLVFKATGSAINTAFGTAGGGGGISGSAAEAYTNTSGGSQLTLADWNNGQALQASGVQLVSTYETTFLAVADSINAAVLGLSGAMSGSHIDSFAKVDVGNRVGFVADAIQIMADNQLDEVSSTTPSAKSGAGGVITGSAAWSTIQATLDSIVNIGNDVLLSVLSNVPHADLGNRLAIDASSRYDVFDKAQMSSGGAFQVGDAESDVTVTTTNRVALGMGTTLANDAGKIGIGTQSRGNAWATANVSVYGAAGLANAKSRSVSTVNNQVLLGDHVTISALGDVEIYAGRSADHITSNALNTVARADVYNGTAIPLKTDPKAHAEATTNSLIRLGDGVSVTSVLDVWMQAITGDQHAAGEGRGRDLYDGVFSKERTSGTSITSGEGKLEFAGSSYVEAGIHHLQSVSIDKNGNITLGDGTEADIATLAGYSSYNELMAHIDVLKEERTSLDIKLPTGEGTYVPKLDENNNPIQQTKWDFDLDAAGEKIPLRDAEGNIERDENDDIIYQKSDHLVFDDDNNPVYVLIYQEQDASLWAVPEENQLRIDEINQELAVLEPQLNYLTNKDGSAVWVGNMTASAGDVYLEAGRFVVTAGNSDIIANGDPELKVVNRSDKSLVVENLGIINSDGGRVKVSGAVAGQLPSSGLTLTSNTQDKGSRILVDHDPNVGGLADDLDAGANVEARGLISNLGGTVEFHVARGDMLQTGTIEARQMVVYVPNGTYSLNSTGYQSFGFDPVSLRGYALSQGWRPASASQLVDWWINANVTNSNYIQAHGISEFNNWWYGIKDGKRDFPSSYIYNGSINVYQNWGFSNSTECKGGAGCHMIGMRNDSEKDGGSDRGSDWWGFNKIGNYQSKLDLTASYDQVKDQGYGAGSSPAVNARTVFINAGYVDINGTIRAGQQNNWAINVGAGFDAAMADYVAAMGLGVGDVVRLVPGQTLWVGTGSAMRQINPGISAQGGEAIGLVYDVGTGQLRLDRVAAAGGGYVSIRGRVMSSSPDGKILLDDGYGNINVTNDSATQLVLNSMDTGFDNVGMVRIQDLNKTGVDWYVHTPGGEAGVHVYHSDDASALSWLDSTSSYVISGDAASYQTRAGQAYRWTETARVERSYQDFPDGYLAKYPNTVGNWVYTESQDPSKAWKVTSRRVISNDCYSSDCDSNGYLTDYMHQTIGTVGWVSQQSWYIGMSYTKYYGAAFVAESPWLVNIATGMTLQATTTIKADHAIAIQFQGPDTGSVSVSSKGDVLLNGFINNKQGSTDVQSDGNITSSTRGLIDSNTIVLNAGGSLGTADQALRLVTSNVTASGGGLVNVDMTGQLTRTGDILGRFLAGGDLVVTSNRGLRALGNGQQLVGHDVTVTTNGGVTGFSTDITGVLDLTADGDVSLTQASGDLAVNSLVTSGDVVLTLLDGSLLNGQQNLGYTAEQQAYLASVWDALDLKAADAGKESVQSYENLVNSKYQQLGQVRTRLADAGLGEAAREALEQQQTDLEAFFATEVSDGNLATNPASGTWDAGWSLTVAAGSALHHKLTDGAHWSDSALELAISASALDPTQTGDISNRPANIEGRQVALNVSGNAGIDLDNAVYLINKSAPDLTAALKADLLKAGPGDVTLVDGDQSDAVAPGFIELSIRKQDPLKINASGNLLVDAGGQIYLQSDRGAALAGLHAGGDVRVAFNGDVTNAASGGATITGDNLYLSTASGSIGQAMSPVVIDLQGVLHSALAPEDIYLRSVADELQLGQIVAGGTLDLVSYGDLVNWAGNADSFHVKADSMHLVAEDDLGNRHDMGTDGRALRLELGDGELTLLGDNAWLETGLGESALGEADLAGSLTLHSLGDLLLDGSVTTGGNLVLSVDGLSAATGSAATVQGDVTLNAGHANLTDWELDANGNLLVTTAQDATLGVVNAGTDVTLLTGGALTLAHDVQAGGDLVADSASIAVEPGVTVMAGDAALVASGAISLGADSHLALSSLTAQGDSWQMGTDSDLITSGQMTISTVGDMLLAYLETGHAGDNAVVLDSTSGNILGRTDSALHLRATSNDAKAYLTAATGMGDPLVIDVPWLSAKTAQGDIHLISNRDLHAHQLDARNGSVIIDNQGNLHIDDEWGRFIAQVDGLLTADRMTFDQADIKARDGVDVEQVTMNGTGPLEVEAPHIDFALIDVAGLPELNMTLTGSNGTQADWVGANIINTAQVNVHDLHTVNGALSLPSNLSVDRARVRDRLDVTTNLLSLRLDNVQKQAQDVDGQLVTPYGAFWAELQGARLETDALVSRYRLPLLVSYAGQNKEADFSSNVAFYGISGQIVQNTSTQDGNVGVRNHAPRWFERVLNFISIGTGVSEESDTADAVQQSEDVGDTNDYSIEISYRL